MPILVGLDGVEKMSKSKGNYVGVTDEPNDMFGKIMSISDDMMDNYFTLLTDEPTERIAELTDPARTHPKEAKVLLGKTIVNQFWGTVPEDNPAYKVWASKLPGSEQETVMYGDVAAAHFEKVFAKKQLPDEIPAFQIGSEIVTVKAVLLKSGLVESGGEAKRMVAQGAVTIAGQKMQDPNAEIKPENGHVVQVGKRRFARMEVTGDEPTIGGG